MRRRISSASEIVSSRISRSHERFSPRVDSSVIVTVAMPRLALCQQLLPGHSARSAQKRMPALARRYPPEICRSASHAPCYHAFASGLHHSAAQQNRSRTAAAPVRATMGGDESVEWSAENSEVYRQLASVAVPAREEQIATLLSLLPFGREGEFHVVELASGEGMLSQAILEAFPAATVLALDGEESMRQAAAARLRSYGARAQVVAFDIMRDDWYGMLDGADVVVSSLCVHHLNGEAKRALFAAVHGRLSARGCLLLADLVLPQREEARALFATTWDRSARERSLAQTGAAALFDLFARET